jgi:hypothetical protein
MQRFKEQDTQNNSGHYGLPQYVYRKPDYSAFGLTQYLIKMTYLIRYDYFTTHTDLSAHGDVMALPDRFASIDCR